MPSFLESSLVDLYQSAVAAFPRTTRRQYATDTIHITNLHWTPFVGMKTLFVKGLAQNEGKEYTPIILLKNVQYITEGITIVASDGREYTFKKLSPTENDVLVRCDCPDFRWRFRYYNYLDHSLQGPKGKKYEAKGMRPPANPMEMPGMCKHLMKLMQGLNETGVI
jgi:hypothetical protein